MSIEDALALVRDRITRAAEAASRSPSEIRLVAVSKTKPPADVREAYAAGQRDFGENYAQELVTKADELRDLHDLQWHFIGHLQSNKARAIAKVANMVQTIDSVSLVQELGKRIAKDRGERVPVLVEVNVGGESQKHGVSPGDLGRLLDAVEAQPALLLQGLMTIPPQGFEAARKAFEAVSSLRASNGGRTRLPELSMGMSDDMEIAIASGATIVRVGSAIFGSR